MNILNLRFELANPFDRWEYFKPLGCLYGKLPWHKAWELEHSYYSRLLLDAEIQWDRNTDHAGLGIAIAILGYGVAFRFYDTRHWNYETNSWGIYDYSKYEVDYYG